MLGLISGLLPCCGEIVVARYGVSAMLVTLEQDVRESPRTRGQSLAGHDFCHCLGAFTTFTAFQHSCILLLLVARRYVCAF